MSNKRLYITLGIMFISLTINGCSQTNDNSSIVSAFSDSVMEIEIPEPEQIEEPENNLADNEEVEDNIVENEPLTQEELDALLASAPDVYKSGIEGYQQIMEEGSWVAPETGGQVIISEVVGKPGDTSWRQMTDEEAQAYQEQYKYSVIGDAELMNGTWSSLFKGKLYFNPYEYQKAMAEWHQEQIDRGEIWDFENKAQVKLKDGRVMSYKEADEQGLLDDADYIFQE